MKNEMHTEPWVTVHEFTQSPKGTIFMHCALLPPDVVEKALDKKDWELHSGDGMPGHVFYEADDNNFRYLRFGDDDDVEPLVFSRSFHGVHPDFMEISEEFRHYFNLAPTDGGDKLIAFDDSGDPVEVVKGLTSDSDKVEVSLKYLKKFLAVKGMTLAVYYSIDMHVDRTLEDLGEKAFDEQEKGKDYAYEIWSKPWEFTSRRDNTKTFAAITGKKLIEGNADYKPTWLGDEERKHEEFIIKTDNNGEPVYHTSDEDKLSNYFGKNPGAPNFLTPVFFTRDVLKRYYDDPKYKVEDGYLRCGGLWGLRMDNDHSKYVLAYLGDLGHMPYKQQQYWKSYNVPPDGTISETAWQRGFEAKFTDPTRPDLVFKTKLKTFDDKSLIGLGWQLFKPLEPKDEHLLTSLHVPQKNNQKEFDEQVQALTKILVDSLNDKELKRRPEVTTVEGSIAKLSQWVEAALPEDAQQHVEFMQKLQALRSTGTAHRKGENYKKLEVYFKLNGLGFEKGFEQILLRAISMLETLEVLLKKK
jgi:hypothetical protein